MYVGRFEDTLSVVLMDLLDFFLMMHRSVVTMLMVFPSHMAAQPPSVTFGPMLLDCVRLTIVHIMAITVLVTLTESQTLFLHSLAMTTTVSLVIYKTPMILYGMVCSVGS